MASIFIVDVYQTSRSCLFSETLHSVRLATMPLGRRWGWVRVGGSRSKHNASQKFTFRSSGANQMLRVRETVTFLLLPFLLVKKRENFYVIETFLELFLGCFFTIRVVMEDQN